jgi:hypothetical protein
MTGPLQAGVYTQQAEYIPSGVSGTGYTTVAAAPAMAAPVELAVESQPREVSETRYITASAPLAEGPFSMRQAY